MPKPSDDRFEKMQMQSKQPKQQQQHIVPSTTSAAPEEPTETTKTESSFNPVTPVEYIYSSMIPQSKSPSETVEVVNIGKCERCNTGGSSRSGGSITSMDPFLSPEGVELDGGLGALSSDDVMIRLKSSDFFKYLLLPNTDTADAATAAAAMNTEQPPSTAGNGKPPSQQEKIGKLTAKLERSITGDERVLLNMNFRISSRNWIKDYEAESVKLMAMHPSFFHPSLFMSNARGTSQLSTSHPALNSPTDNYEEYQISLRSSGHQPTLMPPLPLAPSQHKPTSMPPSDVRISSSDWVKDFKGESVDLLGPIHPSLFMSNASNTTMAAQLSTPPPQLNYPHRVRYEEYQMPLAPSQHQPLTMNNLPTTSPTVNLAKTSQSSSTASKKKKKKRKQRVLDETRVVEPTDGDVLFGRGPSINRHPGNKQFRQKVLKCHSWYEQSSKIEKQTIANLLVESIKSTGHRFLEKGKDGLWHEVVHGERTKASQTFRDLSK